MQRAQKEVGEQLTVLLVHLVGHEHELALVAKGDEVLEVLLAQALPRGVAGVDEHHGTHTNSLGASSLEGALQLANVQRPSVLLVEVVGHELSAVEGDGGRVQGILRNRHHDTVIGTANHGLKKHARDLTGTVGDENVVRACVLAALPRDEVGNLLANVRVPLGVCVCPKTTLDVFQVHLGTGNYVRREQRVCAGVVHQKGCNEQCQDLPPKRDWLLSQRMRVANVGKNHLLALLNALHGSKIDLSAHIIPAFFHVRVQIVGAKCPPSP